LSNKGINLNCGFSISGILPMVIEDLKLSNFQGGLLQSAFVVSYVVVAPLVGYLGDRYSRRFVTPTIISICPIRHSVFSFIEPLWVAVY
jgi:MFS family permease